MREFALGLLALVIGCGSNDGSPPSFCEEVQQKNTTCGMSEQVNCTAAEAEPEVMKQATRACLLNADCDAYKRFAYDKYLSKSSIDCFKTNGVVLTDMFQCADGSGGVAIQAKCDGVNNCPDASDESGCTS
jgi:hypothetical protein